MGGLPSLEGNLDPWESPWPGCPDEVGRSALNALGPVGGGLAVPLAAASLGPVFLDGTEPNAGADGAMGGGETSLVFMGEGACEEAARSILALNSSRGGSRS
jgi:hypothetical protein